MSGLLAGLHPESSELFKENEMFVTPGKMQSAEYSRNIWSIRADEGTNVEDLMSPSYYAHVTQRLKPGDRLEISAEDYTWFAELYVLSVAKVSAKVALLRYVVLTKRSEDLPEQVQEQPSLPDHPDYVIKWAGANKFRVVRKEDRAVLQSGFQLADEAREWLNTHLREM